MTPPDNTLTLIAGGQKLTGWETVKITRGLEIVPSNFDISLTEKYPGQANDIVVKPGDPCQVMIGNDTVVTGYVDRYAPAIGARQHIVRIMGRSKCEDLVDCSAGIYKLDVAPGFSSRNMVITSSNLLLLATDLCYSFGISVKSLTGNNVPVSVPGTGAAVQFNIILTETPYEIIERVARYAGVLAYDDTDGNLVLANVATGAHSSGFKQGVNVQDASSMLTMDERFSIYLPSLVSTASLSDLGVGGSFFPPVFDDKVPRFRPLIIVSEQTTYGAPLAERRAAWEKARRWGRSQAIRVTCDSWRDSAGLLWTPNFTAPIDLPILKVKAPDWVIAEVDYVRIAEQGTVAQLTLMPKEAFQPEPSELQLYDWQVAQALGGGAMNPNNDVLHGAPT